MNTIAIVINAMPCHAINININIIIIIIIIIIRLLSRYCLLCCLPTVDL